MIFFKWFCVSLLSIGMLAFTVLFVSYAVMACRLMWEEFKKE